MTGTNFRFHSPCDRLKELFGKYIALSHITYDEYRRAIEEGEGDFSRWEKVREKRLLLGDAIWREAFYTFGRDWNAANDYVHLHGIETH